MLGLPVEGNQLFCGQNWILPTEVLLGTVTLCGRTFMTPSEALFSLSSFTIALNINCILKTCFCLKFLIGFDHSNEFCWEKDVVRTTSDNIGGVRVYGWWLMCPEKPMLFGLQRADFAISVDFAFSWIVICGSFKVWVRGCMAMTLFWKNGSPRTVWFMDLRIRNFSWKVSLVM